MSCKRCGVKLEAESSFCHSCGLPVIGERTTGTPMFAQKAESPKVRNMEAVRTVGTKWLKFWTYFSLPLGGVLGILISHSTPQVGSVILPMSVFQLILAYGLHKRKYWAWQWNWVAILYAWIGGATPRTFGSSADYWVKFMIVVLAFGLIWMWPNYIYWKRRRALFS